MLLECYKLLKAIEQRPALWTGANTLESIRTYASGYHHALTDHGIVPSNGYDPRFDDWIANRLGYTSSTAGWVNMIEAHCRGFDPQADWESVSATPARQEDHERSIQLFYQLLDTFRNEMTSHE